MPLIRTDKLPVASDADVVAVRQRVRALAIESGFSLVDQTKIVTAASELARNTVVHGGGGTAELELLLERGRRGVRLTFRDHGPGIADIQTAMRDGFTSGGGLGLGLGGAKRLSNEFHIQSRPGEGTVVRIARWR
jgi:serine/threonine-protein kinase RsbT